MRKETCPISEKVLWNWGGKNAMSSDVHVSVLNAIFPSAYVKVEKVTKIDYREQQHHRG